MSYIIQAYEQKAINLAPVTLEEEVLQNVQTLLETPKYSVPLDRDFGLDQRFIDKPIPVAKNIYVAEILDAIEKYEPRVEVLGVTFEEDTSKPGKLSPRVEVNIIVGV